MSVVGGETASVSCALEPQHGLCARACLTVEIFPTILWRHGLIRAGQSQPPKPKRPHVKRPAFALLALAAAAAQAATPASSAPRIDPKHLSQDVKVLSSDEFEGRAPNSNGETKAVAYLIQQFSQAGLKPGGDLVNGKRSWTQDVPLGRFEIQGPLELSVNAGQGASTLRQGDDVAIRAAMNGSRMVDFKD